jgi:hypothetical protein
VLTVPMCAMKMFNKKECVIKKQFSGENIPNILYSFTFQKQNMFAVGTP